MTEFANDQLVSGPSPARPRLRSWPGVFLLVTMALGAGLTLAPREARMLPEGQNVVQGEWAQAFEKNLDANTLFRQTGVDLWGLVNYALFREGRPGVVIGEDGWLFTTEEFQYVPDEAAETQRKLSYIKEVQARLQASGAQLVVAVVPAKARIYEEYLGRYQLPSYTRNRYTTFVSALQREGVPVTDLLPALQSAKQRGAVFLRTDTHWTPFGAEVAATAIARTAASLNPELPQTEFQTTDAGRTSHAGDLLNYVPLGPLQDRIGPRPDTLVRRTTQQTRAGSGEALLADDSQESDLLGGDAIPVVLVGTSYSASENWNFSGALKQALQSDVLNVAREGKGPILPMTGYLAGQELAESPPELVVWEIPERFIPVSYDPKADSPNPHTP
ncbi:alginate O-acetyltransferase [Deinococcus malanensis]|uniref:Probable alginate O-acetylase AlgJ n=1 Tax=Deinococcus malanensis TaxID=1706855 RepID=A0ABQ2F031_9DEIO|nr:alginate O-acetyltransferase [Deinococcus malanensis]GGK35895.1 alginate O-acetyltransferase [Deinococcus malanensis]